MRPSTACQACRSRRRKCEIPLPGSACEYCMKNKRPCTGQLPSSSPKLTPGLGSCLSNYAAQQFHRPTTLFSVEQRLAFVDIYFEFVHDKFHSIFHRPSVIIDVTENRFPDILLAGIVALSARFSSDPCFGNTFPRERGELFAHECESLLDLRHISPLTVQACILLGAYCMTDGDGNGEAVHYATACRMARILDLPTMEAPTELVKEEYLRIWWSLYMIDVWSSNGCKLPRQMVYRDDIALPMDDAQFLGLGRGTTNTNPTFSTPIRDSSLQAQMVMLSRIFVDIIDINEGVVNGKFPSAVLEDLVGQVSQRLDEWHMALPLGMHDNPSNISAYAASGFGSQFVAMYLGYYHYQQLLYYQFLNQSCRSSCKEKVQRYTGKCVAGAASLCNILNNANAIPGCKIAHPMLGHIIVVASTVQLYTLLFSEDDHAISLARMRLERNFEILTQLRGYWPALDVAFTRLYSFHNAYWALRESSFRMDQWMLKFLSEFCHIVGEREDVPSSSNRGVLALECSFNEAQSTLERMF